MVTGKLRDVFQSIDIRKAGQLGFDDFAVLFHQILHQQEVKSKTFTTFAVCIAIDLICD
jgi:hypothetical protein